LIARRANPRKVINCDSDAVEPGTDVAARLHTQVERLKSEAYDIDNGNVDYARIGKSSLYEQFRQATYGLHNLDLHALATREQRLAFWINLYNALIVDAVIRFGIRKSVREAGGFFLKAAYNIGGYRFSADDIEHGILRANEGHPAIPGPQFGADDPRLPFVLDRFDHRIHFALVCASESCPPINVYETAAIDEQLTLAAQNFVNGGSFRIDLNAKKVHLSKIFQWYAPDFGGNLLNMIGLGDFSAVLRTAGQYLVDSPQKTAVLEHPQAFSVKIDRYDWSLNLV
jgi:hypothetical protein